MIEHNGERNSVAATPNISSRKNKTTENIDISARPLAMP